MRKLAMVIVGACLVIASCASAATPPLELQDSLEKAYDTHSPVPLKTLTPFRWDRVYVFWGYLDGRDVNPLMGQEVFPEDSEVATEDYWMLVFFEKDQPVRTGTVSYPAHLPQTPAGEYASDTVFGPTGDDGDWGLSSPIPLPSRR